MGDHHVDQLLGEREPHRVTGCRHEGEQSFRYVGVVFQHPGMLAHAPITRDSGQPAMIVEMDADQKIGALDRRLYPIRALQQ